MALSHVFQNSLRSNSAHTILPLHRARSHLSSPRWHKVSIKLLNFALWNKGTAIYTSMHPLISQHGVNYYHASLHYHAFMHPFVSLHFHYNQVQRQMLSVPEVTLILGFFPKRLWNARLRLSSGRI